MAKKAKKIDDERPAQAEALKDELETVEGFDGGVFSTGNVEPISDDDLAAAGVFEETRPEGQPYITDESVERALIGPAPAGDGVGTDPLQPGEWVDDPLLIAVTTAYLPPRGDEPERALCLRLIADANGRDSHLTLEGVGVGGHTGTVRIWPDDQTHTIEFDGDTFEQTLGFIATHAIVVIDESDEIRAGTPG